MRLTQYAKHGIKEVPLFVVRHGLFFYSDNDLWSPWVHHAQAFESDDLACKLATGLKDDLEAGNAAGVIGTCELVRVWWWEKGWVIDDSVRWDFEEERWVLAYGDGTEVYDPVIDEWVDPSEMEEGANEEPSESEVAA